MTPFEERHNKPDVGFPIVLEYWFQNEDGEESRLRIYERVGDFFWIMELPSGETTGAAASWPHKVVDLWHQTLKEYYS